MRRLLIGVLAVFCLTELALAGDSFFSVGDDNDYLKLNRFRADWYEEQLLAMHENSLFEDDSTTTMYRFTWLRTFHHPMVFRLTLNRDGTGTLLGKMADGAGGYKPGKLVKEVSVPLTIEEASLFETRLQDAEFWKMTARQSGLGTDGAEWIWEARKNGLYKLVDRWSASDSDLGKVALDLMKKSGLELGEIY
jgi:hypothetical protein